MRVLGTIAAAASVVATGAIAATAGLYLATSAVAVTVDRPALETRAFTMWSVQVPSAEAPQGQLVASTASAVR